MNPLRFLLVSFVGLTALALPGVARAGDSRLFVESGVMKVVHHTQDCFVPMQQAHRVQCLVYPGKLAIVMFRVPDGSNGCGVKITNVSRTGTQYAVHLHNEGIYRLKCSLHWARDGITLIVQPPPH